MKCYYIVLKTEYILYIRKKLYNGDTIQVLFRLSLSIERYQVNFESFIKLINYFDLDQE